MDIAIYAGACCNGAWLQTLIRDLFPEFGKCQCQMSLKHELVQAMLFSVQVVAFVGLKHERELQVEKPFTSAI